MHASADNLTEAFDCHDPLTFQASTLNDPDLPSYMDALTNPDHEGFMRQCEKK